MNSKNQIFDLISLIKVFDANSVSDKDIDVLREVDVNNQDQLLKAIDKLLIPEFRSFLPSAQTRLTTLLRSHLENFSEDFEILFDRVELIFKTSIIDRRAFMQCVLQGIEHSMISR